MDERLRFITGNKADLKRPLLILDADEVLLQFMHGLEAFLHSNGFELRLSSFQITGNVFARDTHEPAPAGDVKALMQRFFAEATHTLVAVPGAADAVRTLAVHADIVVLSNIPEAQRETRQANLTAQGFPYPVIANTGGKGEAVATLAAGRRHFVGFVDDLPPQHSSVAEHAPHVHRLHLVADPRLRLLLPQAADAHARIDDWSQAQSHILKHIQGHGRTLS